MYTDTRTRSNDDTILVHVCISLLMTSLTGLLSKAIRFFLISELRFIDLFFTQAYSDIFGPDPGQLPFLNLRMRSTVYQRDEAV